MVKRVKNALKEDRSEEQVRRTECHAEYFCRLRKSVVKRHGFLPENVKLEGTRLSGGGRGGHSQL